MAANLLPLFLVVHVPMTILSGFGNNMRAMITGAYSVPRPVMEPSQREQSYTDFKGCVG